MNSLYFYLKFIAAIAVCGFSFLVLASDNVEGMVETRILDFDPQSGMKSQHIFRVDFKNQTVSDRFVTGTTNILGINLDSVRDQFTVSDTNFTNEGVSFVITGSTASGVGILPGIDYRFTISINKDGNYEISGCHDGYPAYKLQMNGKDAYSYSHKSFELYHLFGDCDVKVTQ